MDGQQFDMVVKLLIRSRTRRNAARLLVGGVVGAGLARFGLADAEAACKKAGQSCTRYGNCCDGALCLGGKCKCKRGLTNCQGTCKNLDVDEAHCGQCGRACKKGYRCCGGDCFLPWLSNYNCGACGNICPSGQACCWGRCTDMQKDPVCCGHLLIKCASHQVCASGKCCSLAGSPCSGNGDCCSPGYCSNGRCEVIH
jgi:hypothetical protein